MQRFFNLPGSNLLTNLFILTLVIMLPVYLIRDLVVYFSIEPILRAHGGIKPLTIEWLLSSALAITLILVFLSLGFHYQVRRPLLDLGNRSNVKYYAARKGELGTVAREIMKLEEENEQFQAEAARQTANLERLLLISEATRRSLSLENVYKSTLEAVLNVTGFSYAAIHLIDPGGETVSLVASKGLGANLLKEISTERFDDAYMAWVRDTHDLDCVSDLRCETRIYPKSGIEDGDRALVKVPLLAGDRLVGVLTMVIKEVHTWTVDERRWLAAIGRQLGVLIDHIHLTDQTRDLAILQEREWLSQELHDNLAQLLGTIRVLADRMVTNLGNSEVEKVQTDANIILSVAQDAYTCVREELVSLRAMQDTEQDLIPRLNETVAHFQCLWNIETTFTADNLQELALAPARIRVQLLRILQEALANVRRHSRATHVDVTLERMNDYLNMEIHDNGRGFDLQDVHDSHLGIRVMHERAASLGGHLKIFSDQDFGTLVQVRLPMNPEVNSFITDGAQ